MFLTVGVLLRIGFGLFVLMIGAFVVLGILGHGRERRRLVALRSWALVNEWTVDEQPDVQWSQWLPGHNPSGVNLVLYGGVNGRAVGVGQYRWTTHSGGDGSSTTHHARVAVAHLDRPLPWAVVERRSGLSRLARSLSGPGEDATGVAEFDKTFKIRTNEAAAIPAWFTPALIDAQLRGDVPAWSVDGDELLIHEYGTLTDPSVIVSVAGRVTYLASLIDPLPAPPPAFPATLPPAFPATLPATRPHAFPDGR